MYFHKTQLIIRQTASLLTAFGFPNDPTHYSDRDPTGPTAKPHKQLSESVEVWRIENLAAPEIGDVFVLVVLKPIAGAKVLRGHVVDFCTKDIYTETPWTE